MYSMKMKKVRNVVEYADPGPISEWDHTKRSQHYYMKNKII